MALIPHIPGLLCQSPLLRSGQPRTLNRIKLRFVPLICTAQAEHVPEQTFFGYQ